MENVQYIIYYLIGGINMNFNISFEINLTFIFSFFIACITVYTAFILNRRLKREECDEEIDTYFTLLKSNMNDIVFLNPGNSSDIQKSIFIFHNFSSSSREVFDNAFKEFLKIKNKNLLNDSFIKNPFNNKDMKKRFNLLNSYKLELLNYEKCFLNFAILTSDYMKKFNKIKEVYENSTSSKLAKLCYPIIYKDKIWYNSFENNEKNNKEICFDYYNNMKKEERDIRQTLNSMLNIINEKYPTTMNDFKSSYERLIEIKNEIIKIN